MKAKKIILLFIIILSVGCNKNEEWDNGTDIRDERSASFVTAYINDNSEIALDFSTTPLGLTPYIGAEFINDGRPFDTKNLYIILHYDQMSKSSLTYGAAYLKFNLSHADNTQPLSSSFSDLAIQNNDVTYNGYRWDNTPYFNGAVKSVNITCSSDYDASHPAGTPLDDIVMMNYYSAKPFIDSKYQDQRLGDYIRCRTIEPLTEFNKKGGGNLLRADLSFNLLMPPQKPDFHQFIITYCNEDGVTLSTTTAPINLLPN